MQALSSEAQVVLLLCGHFSPRESAKPLTLREYNQLADWMKLNGVSLSGLLEPELSGVIDWDAVRLDRTRVLGLLDRGAALALAVDMWTGAGLWILSRADDAYPRRLHTHLGRSAPSILFGVGDSSRVEDGGLAIVGSRDIDEESERFTADVAGQCAREGVTVVSGGARGVDQIALSAAFGEGGRVVAALPEGLGKAAVAAKYREGIREERLVLVSPYAPHAPFSVGNAMGRNRLIYALGDAALVVNTSLRSGGTWAGAEEELKRERHRTVYVRTGDGLDANAALVAIGAVPFPAAPWQDGIASLLHGASAPAVSTIADALHPDATNSSVAPARVEVIDSYDTFLCAVVAALETPKTAKELGEALGVRQSQLKTWLSRAVSERKIEKASRPVRYRLVQEPGRQKSLFGD